MTKGRVFKGLILGTITLSLIGSLVSCSKKTAEPISKSEILLDTPCKVTIYDNVSSDVLDKAFDKLREIDKKMNAANEDSEISAVNNQAGKGYVKVSDNTFYVIKEGIKYGDLTSEKFDISIGPLVKLWHVNQRKENDTEPLPTQEQINQAKSLVNYKNVLLKEDTKEVMLKEPGMSLDLGGIAKGYAGDAVAEVLKSNGVSHAIIDLGGNILTVGSKTDGTDWKIGVQNPNNERGDYLGTIEVTNKAVVTSGIYERYFIKDGKKYHHILDTSTGYPVDNELASVSIITDKSIDGDALAKAFCFGVDNGLKFIESQKGIEAIFVTKDNKVYVTSGLKNNFKITDNNFKLMN
ncbi:FAD:protein FMN transferase [Clostridium sp. 'White wine YQ']|uniref:FAD:protein FMN transferase n=1 Tax=Clostridium sp. 'White wine YQ' TaxID=3027474 RepID=UPI002366F3C4|nr:FAD:protein FMN transferase [Clostridium sp. 'White wine YQ']MDD7795252.1 FAD:protein FMN transferase [Clostridium sp. 'White wine YQ']